MRKVLLLILAATSLTACGPRCCPDNTPEMTLGVVQREVCQGMNQGDVAQVIGSPNIVSKDKEGHETWIYDKIASEVRQSSSGLGLVFLGGANCFGAGGGFGGSSASRVSTQKTLTVVIKFDENQCVESVNYHSSKF